MAAPKINWLDRAIAAFAPKYGLERAKARAAFGMMARHYEAASSGRRTSGWNRRFTDANAAAQAALPMLRAHSRDLVRNNAWARNGLRVLARNVVGWGITPKPSGASQELVAAWKRWSSSWQCDAGERLTFNGLQNLVLRGVAESGEMLVRRRWRRPEDGLALPFTLQVLEPDHIDTTKNNVPGIQGGVVVYGIEYDAIGRRVAYWLYPHHPGSELWTGQSSVRVDARDVIHVYDVERAGQDRGVPWFAAAILALKDFDEFEDAQLLAQKIASFFAVFKTDAGESASFGEVDPSDSALETLEPGTIVSLSPGQDVKFSQPPQAQEGTFPKRTLSRIAAALGITYEELTGDYSDFNFSSARMSRLASWGNVYHWQWDMMIPQFCDPVWQWAMEAAALVNLAPALNPPVAEWTPPPMPMTDPEKEARANVVRIRSGQASLPQVIREQGMDPDAHLEEIAEANEKLDELEIILDSDPRKTSQTGQAQQDPAAKTPGNGQSQEPATAPAEEKPNDDAD